MTLPSLQWCTTTTSPFSCIHPLSLADAVPSLSDSLAHGVPASLCVSVLVLPSFPSIQLGQSLGLCDDAAPLLMSVQMFLVQMHWKKRAMVPPNAQLLRLYKSDRCPDYISTIDSTKVIYVHSTKETKWEAKTTLWVQDPSPASLFNHKGRW